MRGRTFISVICPRKRTNFYSSPRRMSRRTTHSKKRTSGRPTRKSPTRSRRGGRESTTSSIRNHGNRSIYDVYEITSNDSISTQDVIFTGDDVFHRHNPVFQHVDKLRCEFIPFVWQSFYFEKEFMLMVNTIRYNSSSTNIKFSTI